ncbi:hypothetical protein C798_09090 [Herbaspirillum rubrisubalbicans Os34]|uniref:Uncharacterized protein n=1 Tax=Herbaspirillum rubrisubalbicans Os34 TaxID=1235827 RepID=A0A6M3ZPP8_9BURK|nr:hypothetical protein [Herbaspirillum rubrisubalbicans]QJQ00381.1 hypothetical protein C798_09090 [Herbaspirillum rubrisubalbicans Os34]
MEFDFAKLKNRIIAILMPIFLVGFIYGIVTGKNIGPTYKQLEIMRAEMKWLSQEENRNLSILTEGELSKSGVASSYLIIDPELWRSPSKEAFDEHGWKPLSKGKYCKEGILLEIAPSSYIGKASVSITMKYDHVTSETCRTQSSH